MTGLRSAGAVLTGGASRRMGRNKATLAIGGRPMALRVADRLGQAGCAPVWFQGGDDGELASLGAERTLVADPMPGAGPAAAIDTVLRVASSLDPNVDGVVIAACDLVDLDVTTVQALCVAGGRSVVAIAVDSATSPRAHLLGWWSIDLARLVRSAVAAGVTSYRDLLATIGQVDALDHKSNPPRVVRVEVAPTAVRNANTPADLPPDAALRADCDIG